jgi:hypothetical protein
MANVQHETLANQPTKMHGIVWQTVANAAALAALTIDADDVAQKKVIFQTDTGQFWYPSSTVGPQFKLLGTPLAASSIDNDSTVAGSKVSDALNTLGLGSLYRGANLSGTANSTVEREDGCLWVLPDSSTTANRSCTLAITGTPAPVFPYNFVFVIGDQANTYAFINGGPAAGTMYTVPASQPGLFYFQFDGLNFFPAGFGDLP